MADSVRTHVLEISGETYITIDGAEGFNARNEFTFEAWVKPTTTATQYLLCKNNNGDVGEYSIYLMHKGLVFYHRERPPWYQSSTIKVPINEWSFVAVSYDPRNLLGDVYIGSVGGSPTRTTFAWDGTTQNHPGVPVYIGAEESHSKMTSWFQGQMAEFRVWDEYRTADQIADDMTESVSPNDPNLIAYWPMNSSAGARIVDISTNDHDGSITSSDRDVKYEWKTYQGAIPVGTP